MFPQASGLASSWMTRYSGGIRQEITVVTIEPLWKRKYEILKGYIAANPEIHIASDEVCVPEKARNGFYDCFDGVRRAFVESWLGALPLDAHTLAKNYAESENRICRIVNHGVEMPLDLSLFLHDPEQGAMRLIYNRLFELLQGKIHEDDFERIAERCLAEDAPMLFRLGYAAWSALAIILQLEPDEFFGVALDKEGAPCVAGIERIAFGRQFHHQAKRIPEFMFHSKKLGSYVAFKMPPAREVEAYKVPTEMPTQRLLRNRNGDSSDVLDYRMMFLSVARDVTKIPVFADLHKRTVSGPDIAIEYLMKQDVSDGKTIQGIKTRMEILKPRLGGYALIMNPSESESFDIGENINAVSAGLNPLGFQPVIDKLVQETNR